VAAGALALAGAVGCGIGIGRDLRSMPAQLVVYDDLCQVQGYFDDVAAGKAQPPRLVSSSDVQRSADHDAAGGVSLFAFESEAQLTLLRRVLTDNWSKLPPKLMTASHIELQVKWAEKAGVRRVVTTEDAELSYDGKTGFLPYHVCLSELLFGAPLYKTRRELLGLEPVAGPIVEPPAPAVTDGGVAPDAALHD
jgi:hypothetical protein